MSRQTVSIKTAESETEARRGSARAGRAMVGPGRLIFYLKNDHLGENNISVPPLAPVPFSRGKPCLDRSRRIEVDSAAGFRCAQSQLQDQRWSRCALAESTSLLISELTQQRSSRCLQPAAIVRFLRNPLQWKLYNHTNHFLYCFTPLVTSHRAQKRRKHTRSFLVSVALEGRKQWQPRWKQRWLSWFSPWQVSYSFKSSWNRTGRYRALLLCMRSLGCLW